MSECAVAQGKLWVDRSTAPKQTAPKQTAPKQTAPKRRLPAKPLVKQRTYQARPVAPRIPVQNGAPNGRYGASSARAGVKRRANGIERRTLAPIGNAPIDQQYGAGNAINDLRNKPPGAFRSSGQEVGGTNWQGRSGGPSSAQLWRGMNFETFRDAVLKLDGGGGSPVLNNLFAAVLVDRSIRFANSDPKVLDLLKMVVLYRMGRIGDLAALVDTIPERQRTLPMRVFQARALLASGEVQKACALATRFPVGNPDLGRDLLAEALMMTALCAAQEKDLQTVGLMAELARDKGVRSPLSYAVIDYLLSGVRPNIKTPQRLGVRDYAFLRLTGSKAPRNLLKKAEPALVYALAVDRTTPVALRLDAAERAASTGQINAQALARIYSEVAGQRGRNRAKRQSDAQTRALLYDGLSRTNDPLLQAKIIDTLLANVRRVHLSSTVGPMLLPYVRRMQPGKKLDWFATRAIEVALLSSDMKLAERWFLFVQRGGRGAYGAAEWLPLAQLVKKNAVPSSDGTQMALRMARARRLDGRALHGLTSVLDALAFDVPIPLWNSASKHGQPKKGALPATGVLGKLKKLSEEGRAGEVLLLSMQAVGTHSADEMHLLALGDIVRALKKTGFEREAGLFGFRALYGIWPTGATRIR
ncbi:MAG: hypothetical protein L3J67_01500 [Hyphomicrobiaceae bacterium]|nr:hypothetical protein [Hyphomicrobiaceae bacterium]